MLLTKEVDVYIRSNNKDFFIEKGYTPENGKNLRVKVEDLPENSCKKVDIKCDYCEKIIFARSWKNFLLGRQYIDKDACFNCRHEKEKEICRIKYGVDSVLKLPSVRTKGKNTMKERYGEEIPARVEKFLNKAKETMKERYGADNPRFVPEFVEKTKRTCLEKYGVENPLCNGPLRDSFYYKTLKTKSDRGYIPISQPQEYLGILYEAKVNIVLGKYYIVDLFFENDNIYGEYDGSGHKINVTLGEITEEEFKNKERKRYFALKKEGYKLFRIINITRKRRDKLPNKDTLLIIKDIAFYILKNTENNFINFNLDEQKIEIKEKEIYCDFDKGLKQEDFKKIINLLI